MNSLLLNRELGSIGLQTLERALTSDLVQSLQPSPLRFQKLRPRAGGADEQSDNELESTYLVHNGGVNSIAIDRFEGRYLLSGGGDAVISLWDLEASSFEDAAMHKPLGSVLKGPHSHQYGVTHVTFYPFDSLAFLSSSYDHTVKLFSAETLTASASFDLDNVVYSHAMSPIASHLMVACATQHPTVRLLDLKSGANTHSLVGHSGTILSVAWSPVSEHILASAGSDGTVRVWDIRRSVGELGVLDLEDSVGVPGYDGLGRGARRRGRGTAHSRASNGIMWTGDGRHLISTGHDERVRVWNMTTGANTLVNFGPLIRNSHPSTLLPLLTPSHLLPPGKGMLFFPCPREILGLDLFDGQLINRLRVQPLPSNGEQQEQKGVKARTTSLAWREHHVELYSGHGDGSIRAWLPRTKDDEVSDEIEKEEDMIRQENRKRKRQALEEIYQSLTRQPGGPSWA